MCSWLLARLQIPREKDGGQLGLSRFPKTTLRDVPFPVELYLPGVRVVSLAASRWSVDPIPMFNKLPHISHTLTGLSTHLTLMVVCMSGVGAYYPLHSPQALEMLMTYRGKPFATPGTMGGRLTRTEGVGFSGSLTTAWTPLKLRLPSPMRTIR